MKKISMLALVMVMVMVLLSATVCAAGDVKAAEDGVSSQSGGAGVQDENAATTLQTGADGTQGEIVIRGFSQASPVELEAQTGVEASLLELPATLEAQTDGGAVMVDVTWACENYDAGTPDTYTFTAVLPAGYALAEGIALPTACVRTADAAPQEAALPREVRGGAIALMAATGNMATSAPGAYTPNEMFSVYALSLENFTPTTLGVEYTVHLDNQKLNDTFDAALSAGKIKGPGAYVGDYDAYLNGLDSAAAGLPVISFTCTFDAAEVDISALSPLSGALNETESPYGKIGSYSWEQVGSVITFTGTFDTCIYSRTMVRLASSFTLKPVGTHHAQATAEIGSIASDGSISITYNEPGEEITDPATNYTISKAALTASGASSFERIDTPSFQYTVTLTATSPGKLNGKYFSDTVDSDLVIESATVSLNGGAANSVLPDTYKGTNSINYQFETSGTDITSAVITLNVRLKDDLGETYATGGINKTFKNTAKLNRDEAGEKNVKTSNEVSTAMAAKFFDKSGAQRPTNSRYYDWTISLSSSGGRVAEAYIIDVVDTANHEYDTASGIKVYNRDTGLNETGFSFVPISPAGPPEFGDISNMSLINSDACMAAFRGLSAGKAGYYVNAGKMILVIPATSLIGKDVELSYSTEVTKEYDDPTRPTSLTNTAKLVYDDMFYGTGTDKFPADLSFQIGTNVKTEYRWVTKAGTGYDANTQTLSWEFTINQFQTAMDKLIIEDTLDSTKQQFLLHNDPAEPSITLTDPVSSNTRVVAYDDSDPGTGDYYLFYNTSGNSVTLKIHLQGVLATQHYKVTIQTKLVDGSVLARNASKVSVENSAQVSAVISSVPKTQEPRATASNEVTSPLILKDNKIGGTATTYDYAKQTVGWTVTVNPNNIPIKDMVLTDVLPAGTTLGDLVKITRIRSGGGSNAIGPADGNSSIITAGASGGTIDQTFLYISDVGALNFSISTEAQSGGYLANNMTVSFNDFGAQNTTSDTFVFEFKTAFTDGQYRKDKFSSSAATIQNTAQLAGSVYGTAIAANTMATATNNRALPHLVKSGSFFKVNTGNAAQYGDDRLNASGVSWRIVLNRNNIDMGGFTVTDNLKAIFELDKDTFKVYAATLNASGGATNGADITSTIKAQLGTSITFDGFSFNIPAAYKTDTLVVEFIAYMCADAQASDIKNGAEISDGSGWWQGTGDVQATNAQSFNLADYCMACSAPYLSISKATSNLDGVNPLFTLAGAEFTLAQANNNGTVDPDTQKIRVTAANGMATFMFLKKNSLYKIEETAAPAGYVLPTGGGARYVYFEAGTPYSGSVPNVQVVNYGSSVRGHTLDIPNDPAGKVQFRKIAEDGTAVAGITFTLERVGTQHSKTAVSGADGQVSFTKVDEGTYTLKEEGGAGFAYELPSSSWDVVVTKDTAGKYDYNISGGDAGLLAGTSAAGYTIKNYYLLGDAELFKADSNTGAALSGAEFTVYSKTSGAAVCYLIEDNAIKGKYVLSASDTNGENALSGKDVRGATCFVSGKLIYGDYTFSETKAPVDYFPDYGTDNQSTVLLTHDFTISQTATITLDDGDSGGVFKNRYAPFMVDGVALDKSGVSLRGVRIGIFPAGTTEFTEANLFHGLSAISGGDGAFVCTGLPAGSYIMAHMHAPAGYLCVGETAYSFEFKPTDDPAVSFSATFLHELDDPDPGPTPDPADPPSHVDGTGTGGSAGSGSGAAAAAASPQTGDSGALLLYVLLAATALAGICVMGRLKNRI